MPDNNVVFGWDSPDKKSDLVKFVESQGLSLEESSEIVDIALEIARRMARNPEFQVVSQEVKDMLPRFLISVVGPNFSRTERTVILENYPKEGKLDLNSYEGSEIRVLMLKFTRLVNEKVTGWGQRTEVTNQSEVLVTHILIQENIQTNEEEFEKLVSALGTMPDVGVQKCPDTPSKITLFYSRDPFRADLEFKEEPLPSELSPYPLPTARIEVKSSRVDHITVDLLKKLAISFGFRIFSPNLGVYLPKNVNLYSTFSGFLKPEVTEALTKRGYRPVFMWKGSFTCYAQKENDESVYIINGFLLEYLSTTKIELDSEEFSYKVANNLSDFVAKFDADLIPYNFYRHYKKSLKIINLSDFDIDHIDRKVFVKPYVMELNHLKQGFYRVASEGGSVILMTKVLEGETLDDTLKRFLREDLKVADDYIGAVVNPFLEFDIDKQNKLIPRLLVKVYLDEKVLTPEHKEKLNRGWMSTPNSSPPS